jgi:hypothetical protein
VSAFDPLRKSDDRVRACVASMRLGRMEDVRISKKGTAGHGYDFLFAKRSNKVGSRHPRGVSPVGVIVLPW